jgi:hypothetical protein
MKDITVTERLEMLMARRTATKALKFITTNKISSWDKFEIQGDI